MKDSMKDSTISRIAFALFRDLTALGGFVFFAFVLFLSLAFWEKKLFFSLLFGLAFMVSVVVLIRTFYFKNRPRKQAYRNFIERLDTSSFPSLHAARVFFLALSFSRFFGSPDVTILLLAMASLSAYSRIYLKKHDWRDILAGIALGAVAFGITAFF